MKDSKKRPLTKSSTNNLLKISLRESKNEPLNSNNIKEKKKKKNIKKLLPKMSSAHPL